VARLHPPFWKKIGERITAYASLALFIAILANPSSPQKETMVPDSNNLRKFSTLALIKMSKENRKNLGVPWVDNNPALLRGGPNRRKPRRDTCIPRLTFRRLVEQIARDYRSDLRFQDATIEALHEASENCLVHRFVRCARLAHICKIDTVRKEHWRFVRNDVDPSSSPAHASSPFQC
jgi:histone H3/H4